jgi:DNA-binding beta-propeller fold protein YncE/lysophospholipase L1-like esterase
MGDSFSSGEGVPPFRGLSKCHQSEQAYPRQVQVGYEEDTGIRFHLDFVACTGAKVIDVYDGMNGHPSQLNGLTADTDLVTITVGGNDIGFGPVLKYCLYFPHCQKDLDATVRASINALRIYLHGLYEDMRMRAPNAAILVLGYPGIFPSEGHCYSIGSGELRWFQRVGDALDAAIKSQVQLASNWRDDDPEISFLDVGSSFRGHEACSDDPWVNGLDVLHPPYSFHPNARGQTALAEAVLAAISGLDGGGLWAARYDGPSGGTDAGHAMATSPDGSRIFVTGTSDGDWEDLVTIAYDAGSGIELWVARYDGPGRYNDYGTAVAVSPDGSRVFVTGGSWGADFNEDDFATIAYDATSGVELWSARYAYSDDSEDSAMDVAVSPDGSRVFVTGVQDVYGSHDYGTVAYDADTGVELWAAGYDGLGRGFDDPADLAVSPDGGEVFVTGTSRGSSETVWDYATVAYDAASGAELWAARYDGDENDLAAAVEVGPDGSTVFVAGSSYSAGHLHGVAVTLAYDALTGTVGWIAKYGSPQHRWDTGEALSVAPDGSRVYVAGLTAGMLADPDMLTLAFDSATGARLWAARYDGPAGLEDGAMDVVASPTGERVFVTGHSDGGYDLSYMDYATLAYDSETGAQLWLRRYDGPAGRGDWPQAMAISPDGARVFVTGHSDPDQDYDFYDCATVAYAT